MVMSGMVQIFSGERCNVLLNEEEPRKLNRTFHLLPNENIPTMAGMKNIHYLFYIASNYVCHLQRLLDLYTGKRQFYLIAPCQVKGHHRALLNAALYHCKVLLNTYSTRIRHTYSIVYLVQHLQ